MRNSMSQSKGGEEEEDIDDIIKKIEREFISNRESKQRASVGAPLSRGGGFRNYTGAEMDMFDSHLIDA